MLSEAAAFWSNQLCMFPCCVVIDSYHQDQALDVEKNKHEKDRDCDCHMFILPAVSKTEALISYISLPSLSLSAWLTPVPAGPRTLKGASKGRRKSGCADPPPSTIPPDCEVIEDRAFCLLDQLRRRGTTKPMASLHAFSVCCAVSLATSAPSSRMPSMYVGSAISSLYLVWRSVGAEMWRTSSGNDLAGVIHRQLDLANV